MRTLSLLLILFIILTTVNAQPPTLWTQTYGEYEDDRGYSVQQTNDGGFIIAGESDSYSSGWFHYDVYLIKTDESGNELWNQTFGGDRDDCGYSVQQTSDDGYIIVGYNGYTGAWDPDVYLIKTDSSGYEEWNQTFGGAFDDRGYSVQETSDGGYIVVGFTDVGDYDVYLIKIDASGVEQWNRPIGGSDDDRGYSVQQTSDSGYIIAGYTMSYGAGEKDVYLVKTDASGSQQWSQVFGGSDDDYGKSVQQASDGGYIIAGYTSSYGAGGSDVYLVKTDEFGIEQWSQTFGGLDSDMGHSVRQTSDGGYIIAGSTYSFGAAYMNIYLIKTDYSGNQQWSQALGGQFNDYGECVQQTSNGGYIIAGRTESYGAGGTDVWLIHLDSETGVNQLDEPQPLTYYLLPAYPNPFNPSTVISFELQVASFVELTIYDISGSKITSVVNGWRDAGMHEVTFNGSNLASGVYIYRLKEEEFVASGKMVLMK
ncbi:hypothetical protein CEE37_10815 [candidate division LCP-89 bacterium B3_LCP]|uniref:Secretion system C-terminal sorting domain-containing protein n=1 Tax=candidate division LCP-89 bacterium B3_LCP TaxID=2012998 RepID=A0A532UXU5_UNCL8|nr:MAG: hypothetical protein CEE37_10815 [candidate division LCP-89 bacterium B3_LCP]